MRDLLVLILCLAALPAGADEPDAASVEALAKTQQFLKNPAERDAVIAGSANARAVDAQVRGLLGSGAGREGIYSLSGDVLEDLVKATGGDTNRMLQLLQGAEKDPQAFFDGLSEKSRQAIRELSSQATPPGAAPK